MFSISLIIVIILALAFDFINGFHDTANSIATSVSTKVLSPRAAIIMAACLNFVGALVSGKVAKTISGGVVNGSLPQYVIMAAIIAAIIWNLITWYFGIPSSSSHALIGGLVGASLTYAARLDKIIWAGVLEKVVLPLITSPIIGFILGFLFMQILFFLVNRWSVFWPEYRARLLSRRIFRFLSRFLSPHSSKISSQRLAFNQYSIKWWFSKLQIFSAALMSFEHGKNDAQKSMGIITLALISSNLLPTGADVPMVVMIMCALAMALGTSIGGWKIIRKMGEKMIKLEPINGFAAETSAALVISTASALGAPVSTTHVISSTIMGVGTAKRRSAMRWEQVKEILRAWLLTIPFSALLGALITLLFKCF